VAVVVLVAYPLPPVTFAGRLRPVGLLRFLLRFLADLVVSSIQVSLLALRPGGPPRSANMAVPLRIVSDLNLTLVAEAVSLLQGSLIVETDRATGTLYVHVLGVTDRLAVEAARHHTFELENRLVRAFGSDTEVRRLSEPVPPAAHRSTTPHPTEGEEPR
jgi:multicomponent Na+:H+ antiporter subunit E